MLEVFEVAGQPDVAEYCLLELVVERIVRAIDTDARLLLLHGATFGLHPVHIVFIAEGLPALKRNWNSSRW
jgi:hypothetical protein